MAKQKFDGNAPSDGVVIGEIDGFRLFNIPKYNSNGFMGFKLVSLEPRKVKANYWLSWSMVKNAMIGGRDWKLLEAHQKKLADDVLEIVSGYVHEQ